jgi:flavodoxin
MEIAIIVFSNTGHTLEVAKKLKKAYEKKGHSVNLEEIKVKGGWDVNDKKVKLEKPVPDPSPYDNVVFAASVQAFSLCVPMRKYFSKVKSLKGKKVAILITQYFPFEWMGGKRTIGQMTKICKSKGAKVVGSGDVNWSFEGRRKKKMAKVVKHLSKVF